MAAIRLLKAIVSLQELPRQSKSHLVIFRAFLLRIPVKGSGGVRLRVPAAATVISNPNGGDLTNFENLSNLAPKDWQDDASLKPI